MLNRLKCAKIQLFDLWGSAKDNVSNDTADFFTL